MNAYIKAVCEVAEADIKGRAAALALPKEEYTTSVQTRAVQKLMDAGMHPTEVMKLYLTTVEFGKKEQKKE
jgi:hypothetical protein